MNRILLIAVLFFSFCFGQQIEVVSTDLSEIQLSVANAIPLIKEVENEQGRFLRLVD